MSFQTNRDYLGVVGLWIRKGLLQSIAGNGCEKEFDVK